VSHALTITATRTAPLEQPSSTYGFLCITAACVIDSPSSLRCCKGAAAALGVVLASCSGSLSIAQSCSAPAC